MTIYATGRMKAGKFVGIDTHVTPLEAMTAAAMPRYLKSPVVVAELESVAKYVVEHSVKVVRELTDRCERRIEVGDYVDGEGLLVYVMGWFGVPYVLGLEDRHQRFVGMTIHPTLKSAEVERVVATSRDWEEEYWPNYFVLQMRVAAWLTVDDDLNLVRTPVGPETPLDILEPPEPQPAVPVTPEDSYEAPEEDELWGPDPVPVHRSFWDRLWNWAA